MDERQYLVIEIQKMADGTIAPLTTVHPNINDALNKFHTVLAYAAVSTIPRHSCVLLDEDGYSQRQESFEHPVLHEETEETANE